MSTGINSESLRACDRRFRDREALEPEFISSSRLVIVDEIRGLGIIGMVIYHLAWDLSFFGLISVDVTHDVFWIVFARVVAGTFMIIVGISLVLAHQRSVKWSAFLRRLATLAAAAALVTGATYAALPEQFVYFGILHLIVLASLLALPFLMMPIPAVIASAGVVLVAPLLVRSEMFDGRLLAWSGFAVEPAASVDFVPIFPWLGLTLMGIVLARLILGRPIGDRLVEIEHHACTSTTLKWAGRNSLMIYLLHQPILFGSLYFGVRISGM